MSVSDINNTHFDSIIIGSSLANCVLFAALSRAGQKVALFEPQQWHGFMNASMSLSDFHNMVKIIEKETEKIQKNQKKISKIQKTEEEKTKNDDNFEKISEKNDNNVPNYVYIDIADERSKPPQKVRRRMNHGQIEIEYGPDNEPEEGLSKNMKNTIDRHLRRTIKQQNRLQIMEDVYMKRKYEIDEKRIKIKEEEEEKERMKKIQEEEKEKEREKNIENNDQEKEEEVHGNNDGQKTNDDESEEIQSTPTYDYPDEIEETILEIEKMQKEDDEKKKNSEKNSETKNNEIDEKNNKNETFLIYLRQKLRQKLPYEVLTGHLPYSQLISSPHACIPFPSFEQEEEKEEEQEEVEEKNKNNIFFIDEKFNKKNLEKNLEKNEKNSLSFNIYNDLFQQSLPFPLHNAHEYVCDSSLPVSKLTNIESDLKINDNEEKKEENKFIDLVNNKKNINIIDQKNQYETLIKRSGYRYVIDLIHQEVYATSLAIKSIVEAKIHEYHEFRAINKTSLLTPPSPPSLVNSSVNKLSLFDPKTMFNYTPSSIPSSKMDIFNSSLLSLRGKHKLSSILLIIQHDKRNAQCTQWHHSMYYAYRNKPISYLIFHVCNPNYISPSPSSSSSSKNKEQNNFFSSPISSTLSTFSSFLPSNSSILSPTNAFSTISTIVSMAGDVTSSAVNSTYSTLLGDQENNVENIDNKTENQDNNDKNIENKTQNSLSSSPQSIQSIQSPQNTTTLMNIIPLSFIDPIDFEADLDAVLITKIISAGLVQYLPPAVVTAESKKINLPSSVGGVAESISALSSSTLSPSSSSSSSIFSLPNNQITHPILLTSTVSGIIKQHLQSIGKYSSSAYIYPMYGIGEIAQAWIYNACVWGGFGVVRMALAGIILPKNYFFNNNEKNSVNFLTTTMTGKKNDGNDDEKKNPSLITLLTQSGQLITTKTLICDRILSPFSIDTLKCIDYQGLDESADENKDKSESEKNKNKEKCDENNDNKEKKIENIVDSSSSSSPSSPSNNIQDTKDETLFIEKKNDILAESKDDNLVQPTHIIESSFFSKKISKIDLNVKTTQHIVLIVDSLPKHFNIDELSNEQVSIQSFIIPSISYQDGQGQEGEEWQEKEEKEEKGLLKNKNLEEKKILQNKQSTTTTTCSTTYPMSSDLLSMASSKIFITEPSVGLSTNDHYMISITTTLFSTLVSTEAPSAVSNLTTFDSNLDLIQNEYNKQIEDTKRLTKPNINIISQEEKEENDENDENDNGDEKNIKIPEILKTLPQLAPFFSLKTITTTVPTTTTITMTTTPTTPIKIFNENSESKERSEEEEKKIIEKIESSKEETEEDGEKIIGEMEEKTLEKTFIDTSHVKYIASYCYTSINPVPRDEPMVPASAIQYTTTQPLIMDQQILEKISKNNKNENNNEKNNENEKNNNNESEEQLSSPNDTSSTIPPVYPNVFITHDIDQGKITIEDSFIIASHQFYAVMNYHQQLSYNDDSDNDFGDEYDGFDRKNIQNNGKKIKKGKKMLQFLMTQKEEVIDEETGQALQRLEDRNPQLAHTMEVMDSLEEELARIEAIQVDNNQKKDDDDNEEEETNSTKQKKDEEEQNSAEQKKDEENVNNTDVKNDLSNPVHQSQHHQQPNLTADDEADILASLDDLNLEGLDGLDF